MANQAPFVTLYTKIHYTNRPSIRLGYHSSLACMSQSFSLNFLLNNPTSSYRFFPRIFLIFCAGYESYSAGCWDESDLEYVCAYWVLSLGGGCWYSELEYPGRVPELGDVAYVSSVCATLTGRGGGAGTPAGYCDLLCD